MWKIYSKILNVFLSYTKNTDKMLWNNLSKTKLNNQIKSNYDKGKRTKTPLKDI